MDFKIVLVIILSSKCYCYQASITSTSLQSLPTRFPFLGDDQVQISLPVPVPVSLPLQDDHNPTSEAYWDETAESEAEVPKRSLATPIRESLYVVIPMTLIYSLIFITGLVGNVSTCIVIARTRMLHSATNYYLFSLSISDLLLLLSGLPQEMYSIWVRYPYIFGEPFCIIRGLAAEASANATVLTITAFTVERWVAICYPLRSHKLSQLSRVVRIIVSIWIVAVTLALPQAARFGLVDEMVKGVVVVKGAWCSIKREFIPYAFEISICVFFLIPMSIITVLYVLIGMKLRKSRRGPSNVNQEITVEPYRYAQSRHSQTHVIRMLVSVVVAFFVCWAPFHCQRLLAIYAQGTKSRTLVAIYDLITHASGILYYLSTCINPVLYNIMSNKFRQAFKDTLTQLCSNRRRHEPHHRTYSVASNRSSRMGVVMGHNLGQSLRRHDTCLNCRHTPSMCSCRGSIRKFVRNYSSPINVGSQAQLDSISGSPYRNYSPAEVNIPLKSIPANPYSQRPSAVRRIEQQAILVQGPPNKKNRLLKILQRKTSRPCDQIGRELPNGRKRVQSYTLGRVDRQWKGQRSLAGRDWSISSTGYSSNSLSSASISNSSLQDTDPNEHTGEELAGCLAEMEAALKNYSSH